MTKEKEIRMVYKDLTAPGVVMLAFWGLDLGGEALLRERAVV